ncbi:MAG: hypothetical protein M3365_00725 [Gemmatimonadota bacterium]|nr:hypothetical protein [Gemmatimonadota bacterium]
MTSLPLVAPALRVFRIVRVVRGLRLVKVVGSLKRGMRALGGSIEADFQLNDQMLSRCSRLFGTGAEDSRGMLSTIATRYHDRRRHLLDHDRGSRSPPANLTFERIESLNG